MKGFITLHSAAGDDPIRINPEHIQTLTGVDWPKTPEGQKTRIPDTVIHLASGTRLQVRESADEVERLILELLYLSGLEVFYYPAGLDAEKFREFEKAVKAGSPQRIVPMKQSVGPLE